MKSIMCSEFWFVQYFSKLQKKKKVLVTFATFGASLKHDCVQLHAIWDPDEAPLLAVGHAAADLSASVVLVLRGWSWVALQHNLLCGWRIILSFSLRLKPICYDKTVVEIFDETGPCIYLPQQCRSWCWAGSHHWPRCSAVTPSCCCCCLSACPRRWWGWPRSS